MRTPLYTGHFTRCPQQKGSTVTVFHLRSCPPPPPPPSHPHPSLSSSGASSSWELIMALWSLPLSQSYSALTPSSWARSRTWTTQRVSCVTLFLSLILGTLCEYVIAACKLCYANSLQFRAIRLRVRLRARVRHRVRLRARFLQNAPNIENPVVCLCSDKYSYAIAFISRGFPVVPNLVICTFFDCLFRYLYSHSSVQCGSSLSHDCPSVP